MPENVTFSRSFIELIGIEYGSVSYDFAFGEYLATKDFFEELSDLQNNILTGEDFTLPTGQTIDPESPGGMIAVQLYMEAMDSKRMAVVGLAKAGYSAEKQTWKNI
jgi:hypothetical protein